MPKIYLKKNEENRLKEGHLWIFSNEISKIEGNPGPGDTVELRDSGGNLAGIGFYNPNSLIAFRLLSRKNEILDRAFWAARIQKALDFRKSILPGADAFRAVFGESDMLPGLIVDKYAKYLSVQFVSAGIEKNREDITGALIDVFSPLGIIARNESHLRKLEGLEEKTEILFGNIPENVGIEENGIKYAVNLAAGQKTGFFFDQRENRKALEAWCKGGEVLDCYCHTGGFGISAARAGAKSVIFVDSSKKALESAAENAELNGVEGFCEFVEADAEKYLAEPGRSGKKFDIIILDPPALIKSRKNFFAGVRLYEKINVLAMRLLKPGGILASSSCSHHLGREEFVKMLRSAAAEAGKQFNLIELRSQAKDHPVLLSMPETEYLKFALLKLYE
jgi:23S rRNA (cytosine1962-C5)-methyltransferase